MFTSDNDSSLHCKSTNTSTYDDLISAINMQLTLTSKATEACLYLVKLMELMKVLINFSNHEKL